MPLLRGSAQLFAEDKAPKKRILFFTRSQTFEHSVIRRISDAPSHAGRVMSEFAGAAGFEFHETKDGSVFDGDLDQYDAFFFFTTGDLTKSGGDKQPPMSEKGKQRLLDAIAAGKGMFGSHCASDTFHSAGPAFENQSERDPYIDMLGGEFIRHGRQQEATQRVVDAKFPGMGPAGMEFRMHEEWYSLKNFAQDMHVLLVQETKGMKDLDYDRPPFPATWVRRHNQGRVFYTSMGHREDVWTNAIFQSIVVGGLQWVTRQFDADIKPNMAEVTPEASKLPVPK
ncbi:MAG: ThuA domain-containing protein [Pirellulaceae bacterium]|nr:ThuA domain-containing protein [Pirellulaceae bacterium]